MTVAAFHGHVTINCNFPANFPQEKLMGSQQGTLQVTPIGCLHFLSLTATAAHVPHLMDHLHTHPLPGFLLVSDTVMWHCSMIIILVLITIDNWALPVYGFIYSSSKANERDFFFLVIQRVILQCFNIKDRWPVNWWWDMLCLQFDGSERLLRRESTSIKNRAFSKAEMWYIATIYFVSLLLWFYIALGVHRHAIWIFFLCCQMSSDTRNKVKTYCKSNHPTHIYIK